jgi:hypothetical protein
MATVTKLPRAKRGASIEINLAEPDADGTRALEAAAAAAGGLLADVLLRFAGRRAAAGQPLTVAELDSIGTASVRRMMDACARSLGTARGPGATLIATAVGSRGHAPKRSAGTTVNVQNVLPELVEVATEAQYDASGRMIGTRTIKQRAK